MQVKVNEDGNWDARDSEARDLGFCLYGRPLTTIFHLENVFNHLATVIRRIRKNAKMNRQSAVIIVYNIVFSRSTIK